MFFKGTALFLTMATFCFASSSANAIEYDTAVLQGLDKVTAQTKRINVPVGRYVRFGTLDISVKKCDKRPPEETPESAAFVEVNESKPGEKSSRVFMGWMFASSPALNPMEHPVYDLWVLDCKNISENSDNNSDSVGSE